jgi:protease-4
MATRTQGLFLGCFLVAALGVFFLAALSWLVRGSWFDSELALGDARIGLVLLEGPIDASRDLVEELEANERDGSIKAVVLRVDSPGGEVAPSQELYEAVRRLAARKPVVASLGSVAASGGYYVAVGADSIVANPGSLVGSIGVIFAYPSAQELMDKVGLKYHVFKSGGMKDLGSFARPPTEEEEAVFDAIVADVYDQFVAAVSRGRRMDRQVVLGLADGRIFSGRQAQGVGLVDRVGDLKEAVRMAAAMAGVTGRPTLVRKSRPRIPILAILDDLLREGAKAAWGPRLEYRLR